MYKLNRKIATAFIAVGLVITGCTIDSENPVPETVYPVKLIGSWQGTVGGVNETMTLKKDGTFKCVLQPTGFLGTTLSEGKPGKITGRWDIKDTLITLRVTGEKNRRLANTATYSRIKSFRENRLVLISDIGDTTVFKRVKTLHPAKNKAFNLDKR